MSVYSPAVLATAWRLLPETATHVDNLGQNWALRVGFQTKAAGLDWRDWREVGALLDAMERAGYLWRDGETLRRGNRPPEEVTA